MLDLFKKIDLFTTLPLLAGTEKSRTKVGVLCLFCNKTHKLQSCKIVTHIENRRNVLKDKRCFVRLKAGHSSKDCVLNDITLPYAILIRLTIKLEFLKTTRPLMMVLQKKKQLLILILHRTLFYFKLPSLLL